MIGREQSDCAEMRSSMDWCGDRLTYRKTFRLHITPIHSPHARFYRSLRTLTENDMRQRKIYVIFFESLVGQHRFEWRRGGKEYE